VSADEATIDHTLHALAFTAGITIPGNPLDNIRPSAVQLELSMAWPRFISAYAAAAPVILVLEDLHWAGDRLVEMVQRLLARSTGPVLLVTTARPELRKAHPEFGEGGEGTAVFALRALTTQQSTTLLGEILEGSEVPEALRRDLVATADGNPLFLEEIIRRLVDGGTLVRQGSGWSVAGTLPTALPDTVLAVLGARIDALPPAHKREEVAGEGSVELAELIAHHYRTGVLGEDADLAWGDDPAARAELRNRAFAALLAAGAVARKRFAVAQALQLHQDALRLSAD